MVLYKLDFDGCWSKICLWKNISISRYLRFNKTELAKHFCACVCYLFSLGNCNSRKWSLDICHLFLCFSLLLRREARICELVNSKAFLAVFIWQISFTLFRKRSVITFLTSSATLLDTHTYCIYHKHAHFVSSRLFNDTLSSLSLPFSNTRGCYITILLHNPTSDLGYPLSWVCALLHPFQVIWWSRLRSQLKAGRLCSSDRAQEMLRCRPSVQGWLSKRRARSPAAWEPVWEDWRKHMEF